MLAGCTGRPAPAPAGRAPNRDLEPLVWGNDYPHYEGTFPKSKEAVLAQAERAALTTEEQAAIFGGTLARLLGIAR